MGAVRCPAPVREAPPVFEGECDMRVPQVSERIKEAPAQALRGVFAGIGQLLLITDKIRNKAPAYAGAARPHTPTPPEKEPAADTTAAPREEAAAPAPAEPVHAEPVRAEPVQAEPVQAAPVHVEPVQAAPVQAAPAGAAAPKAPTPRDFDKTGNVRLIDSGEGTATVVAESQREDPGLPLPNYDELSIASLRARLRNLDVAQLRQLTDYERAHEARADVIAMFERRIARLEADA